MATKNLGKVAFVFKDDYSSLITYDKYDVVFDGESSYISLITNNLGNALSNTSYWKPLCKGNYLAISGKADKTTSVIAGAGLTGGGDLSANSTFNVASANDGITVNADNIQLNAVNNLTSTSTTQPLAANQGNVLKGEITQLSSYLNKYSYSLDKENWSNSAEKYVTLELGNIKFAGDAWTYSSSTTRVRTTEGTTIHLKSGDVIGLSDYTNARFIVGIKPSNAS